tara:strand:+ start:442 stop:621 length:180 start_codon:yes stop_codon:yes gene_type:complete
MEYPKFLLFILLFGRAASFRITYYINLDLLSTHRRIFLIGIEEFFIPKKYIFYNFFADF